MRDKLVSIGDDVWIENDRGKRAFKVDGKALRLRRTLVFETPDGREVARIQQRVAPVRDTIRGGRVTEVSKRWFRVRDSYGVEMEPGQDDIVVLVATVAST